MHISTSHRGKIRNVNCLWGKFKRSFLKSSNLLRGEVKKREISNRKDCLARLRKYQSQIPQRTGRNGFCRIWRLRRIPARPGRFSRFSSIIYGNVKRKKNKRPKSFGGRRFQIGRRCLRLPELSPRAKIPDLLGDFQRISRRPQYSSANSNSGPSSNFRASGTSTRTFPDGH